MKLSSTFLNLATAIASRFFNAVLKKFQEKMQIAQVDRIDNSEQRFSIFKLPFIGKASVDFKKDFCK